MTGTIWILGGSGDIGRAVGHRFGREGWSVWLSARRETRLRAATDELSGANIESEYSLADAARPAEVRDAVSGIAAKTETLPVLVYNITPQELDGTSRLEAYHRHTVFGARTTLDSLRREGLLPTHVIVPTSSRAREPDRSSPEAYAAKQSLVAYLEAIELTDDVSYSILWLGRRGTEDDWRWLRPEEMAEKAWEAYETNTNELLVGDLY